MRNLEIKIALIIATLSVLGIMTLSLVSSQQELMIKCKQQDFMTYEACLLAGSE